jgi:hypothetical protein
MNINLAQNIKVQNILPGEGKWLGFSLHKKYGTNFVQKNKQDKLSVFRTTSFRICPKFSLFFGRYVLAEVFLIYTYS